MVQAVLIIVNKEKNKLENQEVIDAVNENLLIDILNYDERQLLKWQITVAKEYTVNKHWEPATFRAQSQCAAHLCDWINIIFQIIKSPSSHIDAR